MISSLGLGSEARSTWQAFFKRLSKHREKSASLKIILCPKRITRGEERKRGNNF
jgi:hypothetical protein